MFKRIVDVVEYVALGCAALALALLLFYKPSSSKPRAASSSSAGASGGQAVSGQSVFIDNCATCHGSKGEGGIGPKLGGGAVVSKFPNETDQILVVTSGRDGMPAFGERLSADEIKAVVEYTRTGL